MGEGRFKLERRVTALPGMIIWTILLCFLLCSALSRFAGGTWFFEINSSAAHYYVIGHIVLTLIYFRSLSKNLPVFALWLLIFSLQCIRVWPYIDLSGSENKDTGTFRVMEINVNTQIGDPAKVRSEIKRLNPDVLGLLEVSDGWLKSLSLDSEYPYSKAVTRNDNFGIAIYSKHPFEGDVVTSIGEDLPPVILARALVNGAPLDVVLVHALPPVSQGSYDKSWLLLRRLAAVIRDKEGPLIVLGDLNSAPWGGLFNMFRFVSRTRSAAEGRGIHLTWRAQSWIFKFPIDHILVKGGLRVANTMMGQETGSDHLPLFADVAFSK